MSKCTNDKCRSYESSESDGSNCREYHKSAFNSCSDYIPKGVEKAEIAEEDITALDVQVGGDHYKNVNIQPVVYTHKNNLNFCQGSIVKYITRYKNKNGIEDLEKAKHYIDLLIELEYGDDNQTELNV